MTAYYNEHDPQAAEWLRELIKSGQIAPGDVDTRSIEDVRPDDLVAYRQCHFFAGIGGWSHALRLAGWPDDKPVWTGSCPCQPFSAAGKGAGFADERHLWPHFHHLISQCEPATVFGEQVASLDGLGWLDLVQADLEATGYAFGAADLCAAGVGAPHIRQRLFWVANADIPGQRAQPKELSQKCDTGTPGNACTSSRVGGMADPDHNRFQEEPIGGFHNEECDAKPRGGNSRLANATSTRPQGGAKLGERADTQQPATERNGADGWLANACDSTGQQGEPRPVVGRFAPQTGGDVSRDGAGPLHGFWRAADWLACRDGVWRPVEPSTFPLAHGVSARVGRLRGYGNAIVPQVAAAFVRAAS